MLNKKKHTNYIEVLDNNTQTLSTLVGDFLSTYYVNHKDHLPQGRVYDIIIQEVEKSLLAETLKFCDNNQTRASAILGINRNTLRKKMLEYQLDIIIK